MSRTESPIAIVGAGISGLALGYFLRRWTEDFVILEASGRTGGVIETRRTHGHVLELGPQRARLTAPLLSLIESLDLGEEVITAPCLPLYVFSRGKLRAAPLDIRTALTTDLLTWRDRMRALIEPLTAGLMPHESAADFFIRKFGCRTYERVFAPLFGDLYGSDPADMPARHALASYLRTLKVEGSLLIALLRSLRNGSAAPAFSFRGGLQTLTDALARVLDEHIRTDHAVHGIHRDGDELRVVTTAGEIRTNHVVLTCPAAQAARALTPLDAATAERLCRLRYNELAVVHLHSAAAIDGMGYQVTYELGYATRGVTCNHTLFGRNGVYTAFLGGATHPDVTRLGDDDLGMLAAAEFRAITGAESRPLAVHRTRMPSWDASWNGLDGLSLPDGVSVCANWRGRPGMSGRLGEAAALAAWLAAA